MGSWAPKGLDGEDLQGLRGTLGFCVLGGTGFMIDTLSQYEGFWHICMEKGRRWPTLGSEKCEMGQQPGAPAAGGELPRSLRSSQGPARGADLWGP
jgi:hypothetical protein